MATISVIVPIYNVEKYVEKTIISIINQSYKDLEIILVNDGSEDNSLKICQDYAKIDNRIIVLNKKNGGLSDARNYGLDNAKGDYILFVDGDDYIHYQMIEILYTCAQKSSSDIVVCNYTRINENENTIDKQIELKQIANLNTYTNTEALSKLFKDDTHVIFTVVWNKLYIKTLFDEIRFPFGKIHEDDFTSYKLLDMAKKIGYINIPLYYYVKRNGSILSSGLNEKSFQKVDAYIERANYCIKNEKVVTEAINALLWLYGSYIKEYKQKYGENDFLLEHIKKYKECWRYYKKYISVKRAIYIRFKIAHPKIYTKLYNTYHKIKKITFVTTFWYH